MVSETKRKNKLIGFAADAEVFGMLAELMERNDENVSEVCRRAVVNLYRDQIERERTHKTTGGNENE